MKLRNHIPLSGPATREPCDGTESPMRVSLGFTPKWYHDRLGIDFSEPWHLDPEYRYAGFQRMSRYLAEAFPDAAFQSSCASISTLFGIMLVSSCYGIEIVYRKDNWPDAKNGMTLPKKEIQSIINQGPFDFNNPGTLPGGGGTITALQSQMDLIQRRWGPIHGYLNYQGLLNAGIKIRGNDLFLDMIDDPEFTKRFLSHIASTIGNLSKHVQACQRASGFPIDLLSVGNCVVSMVSPAQYGEFVLPHDQRLSTEYPAFGVHTCNWVVDPYLDSLRKIKNMGYIDTGMKSDLTRVKRLFPDARRAVLYTPGEVESKSLLEIGADLERVAREYAPCDIVLADVESTAEDEKIRGFLKIAESLERPSNLPSSSRFQAP